MSAKTTTAQLAIKLPQYAEETVEGTPNNNPTLLSCGPVESISINKDGTFVDVSQIGPEDLISIIGGLKKYEFKVKYSFLDIVFSKYAVNAANYGTPAGTISASITIVFSIYLNGTENFIIMKGCRAKDAQITIDSGKPHAGEITFVAVKIMAPATSHGLGTPVWASVPAGTTWAHLDGGTNPVSWKGSPVTAKRAVISINRNTSPDYTVGNDDPYGTQPHGRRIAVEVMALWTGKGNEDDFDSKTTGTLTVTLKTGSGTLTFTGAVIKSYKRDTNSTANESIAEQMGFGATAVALA